MTALFLAFLIGFFTGLRSLTGPASTAWAAYLGWLKLERPLSLIGSIPSVAILTLFAIVELVADKLPQTQNRTAPPALIARIVMGWISGSVRFSRQWARNFSQSQLCRAGWVKTELGEAVLELSEGGKTSAWPATSRRWANRRVLPPGRAAALLT